MHELSEDGTKYTASLTAARVSHPKCSALRSHDRSTDDMAESTTRMPEPLEDGVDESPEGGRAEASQIRRPSKSLPASQTPPGDGRAEPVEGRHLEVPRSRKPPKSPLTSRTLAEDGAAGRPERGGAEALQIRGPPKSPPTSWTPPEDGMAESLEGGREEVLLAHGLPRSPAAPRTSAQDGMAEMCEGARAEAPLIRGPPKSPPASLTLLEDGGAQVAEAAQDDVAAASWMSPAPWLGWDAQARRRYPRAAGEFKGVLLMRVEPDVGDVVRERHVLGPPRRTWDEARDDRLVFSPGLGEEVCVDKVFTQWRWRHHVAGILKFEWEDGYEVSEGWVEIDFNRQTGTTRARGVFVFDRAIGRTRRFERQVRRTSWRPSLPLAEDDYDVVLEHLPRAVSLEHVSATMEVLARQAHGYDDAMWKRSAGKMLGSDAEDGHHAMESSSSGHSFGPGRAKRRPDRELPRAESQEPPRNRPRCLTHV